MSEMQYETIRVSAEEGVAELRFDRPKALNAINRTMLVELEQAIEQLRADAKVRCLIVTGAGDKAFVAGADIAQMSKMGPEEAAAFSQLGHRVMRALETFPVPTIAALNGFALGGGCELALACDIIYASEKAKLGQPEVKLGLIPGFGGCVRLPRKIGLAAAAEWIFSGEIYSAQSAKEAGLVRQVFPAAELDARVRELARTIAARGPVAVRAGKRVLSAALGSDVTTAAALEREAFAALFASRDAREGMQAFLEKRDPSFVGE